MPHSLVWLPHVLKDAGLKVAPVDGWEERGRGDVGEIFGVICHYTQGPRNGNMPSLGTLLEGRSDLPGPLSQLGLGRDGTYYIIAAGKCNHAGKGVWRGIANGNGNFIGIEAENTGGANDFPWPAVQLDAYHRGVAAILKHVGRGAEFCAGHKEYARPLGRKIDPDLEMGAFRGAVAAILAGTSPPPLLIPATEPGRGRATLRRGDRGPLVGQIQEKLGVAGPDIFGPRTEAEVRAFQRAQGLVPDGIVGPKSWAALDALTGPPPSLAPVLAPVVPKVVVPAPVAPALSLAPPQLAWGRAVSQRFKEKVVAIAGRIGCDPNHLMACMAFETGETFSPSVKNRASGATGLIQFMPSTAADLGTTTTALASMEPEEQLEYVARYFSWFNPGRTLEDLYMAILWPRAIGKPDSYVLFSHPSVTFKQNRGLDFDGDGSVTRFEAATAVRDKLKKGLAAEFFG